MRFACQSCGKAYSLPEERIADKSNVKLKCRVCGAIVEVKKHGELVAQLLDEADAKRVTRVSEAPAPLNTLTPEDDEADGATVSISEGSINNGGPLLFEMPSVPLAPATGFAGGVPAVGMPPAALPAGALSGAGLSGAEASSSGALPPPLAEAGGGLLESSNVAPPAGPPPLSPSSLPPPPLRESPAELAPSAAANGRGEFFGDDVRPPAGKAPELLAPVAPAAVAPAVGAGALNSSLGAANAAVMSAGPVAMASIDGVSAGLSDLSEPASEAKDPMYNKLKMLAAFATGVLVDRIIAGLFP